MNIFFQITRKFKLLQNKKKTSGPKKNNINRSKKNISLCINKIKKSSIKLKGIKNKIIFRNIYLLLPTCQMQSSSLGGKKCIKFHPHTTHSFLIKEEERVFFRDKKKKKRKQEDEKRIAFSSIRTYFLINKSSLSKKNQNNKHYDRVQSILK